MSRQAQKLLKKGLRVHIDDKNESMQKKIRNAQKEKVFYMVIVGDREIESEEVNVRMRDGKATNQKLDDFISTVENEYILRS